jgi:hypothetical protein
MHIDDGGGSADTLDWESNHELREIFEDLCKNPANNIKIFETDPTTSASGTRCFSPHDIHDKNGFLDDLVRKPDLVVVVGHNDFQYHGTIERVHMHYVGKWVSNPTL